MSNYTKSTNFATKDTLTSGDPNKVVKGAEIDAEYNAIQTAVNSKADLASPVFTGDPTSPTPATTDNDSSIATTQFIRNLLLDMKSKLDMKNQSIEGIKFLNYYSHVDNGNSGTSKNIDWTLGAKQKITINANCTFTFTNTNFGHYQLKITHDATANAYTITWPGTVRWVGGTAPTLTNTANSVDIVSMWLDEVAVYASMSKGFA